MVSSVFNSGLCFLFWILFVCSCWRSVFHLFLCPVDLVDTKLTIDNDEERNSWETGVMSACAQFRNWQTNIIYFVSVPWSHRIKIWKFLKLFTRYNPFFTCCFILFFFSFVLEGWSDNLVCFFFSYSPIFLLFLLHFFLFCISKYSFLVFKYLFFFFLKITYTCNTFLNNRKLKDYCVVFPLDLVVIHNIFFALLFIFHPAVFLFVSLQYICSSFHSPVTCLVATDQDIFESRL